MKVLSQRIIFGGWIFWSCISGNPLGDVKLFWTLQEAQADVNDCVQILYAQNSHLEKPLLREELFEKKLSGYLKEFNKKLDRWNLNHHFSGLKQLKDMSIELDDFIANCLGPLDGLQTACQISKKKLDSLFGASFGSCTDSSSLSKPWYHRFYAGFSFNVSRYFQWIKEFFGFSKKALTPWMLASCLGNSKSLIYILNKDSKTLKQIDRHGRTIFHYMNIHLLYDHELWNTINSLGKNYWNKIQKKN